MKNSHPLDRLLRSASQAPMQNVEANELSPNVERRILAQWRSSQSSGHTEFMELVSLFRRGLACAAAITITAVAFTFQSPVHEETDELAITEAPFELALR
jgi:hypothetical protein